MARVFLSFLGINDYIPCTYYAEDRKAENVRFIQEAILKIYCSDWTSADRACFFTTRAAYRKNWLDDGHVARKT